MKTVDKIEPHEKQPMELVPPGLHPAVLVAVYDIGAHVHPVYKVARPKVVLTFETKAGRLLSRTFTNTLSDKGQLKPFLAGWLGSVDRINFVSLLGNHTTLNVVHDTRDGRTFANIQFAGPKMEVFATETKPSYFSIRQLEYPVELATAEIPEWIKDKIRDSVEFKNMLAKQSIAPAVDDDIPY
jgi:hypothetical protein